MSSAVPHIFFCSNLDSPQDWQEALARHLERFIFTVGPACAEPDQVDVALVYKLPPGGLLRFTRLRAVISLSAGINQFAGRGGHVVEADLLQALAEGSIAGATLDVTSTEPLPKDHPLWGHPSVLITPHVAGLTTPATAAPNVAENVRRAMRGEALLNQVEMARGY